jgi:transcriptional regulator with XRE-family HTH domain
MISKSKATIDIPLGTAFREERKRRGLTQLGAESISGISRYCIMQLEQGFVRETYRLNAQLFIGGSSPGVQEEVPPDVSTPEEPTKSVSPTPEPNSHVTIRHLLVMSKNDPDVLNVLKMALMAGHTLDTLTAPMRFTP